MTLRGDNKSTAQAENLYRDQYRYKESGFSLNGAYHALFESLQLYQAFGIMI